MRRFLRLLIAFGLLLGLPGVTRAVPPEKADGKHGEMSTFAELREAGWKVNTPTYPYKAMKTHEQGEIQVTMTTDHQGQIIKAVVPPSTSHPILDAHASDWVRVHWQGPPDMTRTVVLHFQIM